MNSFVNIFMLRNPYLWVSFPGRKIHSFCPKQSPDSLLSFLYSQPVSLQLHIYCQGVSVPWMLITLPIIRYINNFFVFFQTSLQLSWMLFGGNHRTLLGAQMNISQEMTSWLKVNKSILIKMSRLNCSPGCVWNCNCPCGRTWSIFGHPPCTMDQTRGNPGKKLLRVYRFEW